VLLSLCLIASSPLLCNEGSLLAVCFAPLDVLHKVQSPQVQTFKNESTVFEIIIRECTGSETPGCAWNAKVWFIFDVIETRDFDRFHSPNDQMESK